MQKSNLDLAHYRNTISQLNPLAITGRVVQVVGSTVETMGLNCQIGEICEIQTSNKTTLMAEAIGFRNNRMLLMPLGTMEGIQRTVPSAPFHRCSKPRSDDLSSAAY